MLIGSGAVAQGYFCKMVWEVLLYISLIQTPQYFISPANLIEEFPPHPQVESVQIFYSFLMTLGPFPLNQLHHKRKISDHKRLNINIYSTGQNKLYIIYYSVTVPRSDRYRVVLRMQRNINVQFNKTFSPPATV